ncbi:MAG: asparagine synthase (glutamine-hydrolyzing) [Candidatus Aminicenantes bacterium]|nr:asparagine synthase (glutamine-hydrolyzing) [Candidatus Aminicenantes bacterium]
MCGICGFFQTESVADRKVLEDMNRQIFHRGPDDDGYYFYNRVGLAARRLSIIDLVTGHQPLSSHSGNSWITFNGEVYNFKDLRSELKARGFQFRTRTDTEVVVNMYEAFGIDFVRKLRGMFAIGIYDQKQDRLVLARDHVGIKPLYYCLHPENGNLIFGSEIKSILKFPGIPREMDHRALDFFLTLEYIPAPYSIFKHIKKLPAGHILTFEKGKLSIQKYWEVEPHEISADFNELKAHFFSLLSESVKMRMIADVPLGAFLSGGIDSSAIVSTMSAFSPTPIKTFSIGFKDKSYSELKYSNQVAEKFATDHYTKTLAPDINELVHYLSGFFDEPLGDFSNFPTYLVSKIAREKVTVVLSGDGGDEIFGGYEHYIAQKIARTIDFSLLAPFHWMASKITHIFPPSELKKGFVNRIKRFSEGLENSFHNRHFRWMIFLSNFQKTRLYSNDFLKNDFLKWLPERIPFDRYFQLSEQFDSINRDLYLDFKTYLVDDILVKVDRMSMANSLETRVPLLDYKMVEFAFSLPPRFKLRGNTTKWFFKKVMEEVLPREIIYRTKEGFSIPIKNWLKRELKDLMFEYLSESRIRQTGIFNYGYIQNMIDDHLNNRQNHAHRLWALILFFMWMEKYSNGSAT